MESVHSALEECDVSEELALTSSLRTRKEELDVLGRLSLGRICVQNIDALPFPAGMRAKSVRPPSFQLAGRVLCRHPFMRIAPYPLIG